MTPMELGNDVENIVLDLKARILGVGAAQYSEGTTQKFENMPLDDLFEWAHEELDDLIVYSAMLKIRLDRVRQAARLL